MSGVSDRSAAVTRLISTRAANGRATEVDIRDPRRAPCKMRVVRLALALSLIAIHGDIDDEPPPAPRASRSSAPPFTVEEFSPTLRRRWSACCSRPVRSATARLRRAGPRWPPVAPTTSARRPTATAGRAPCCRRCSPRRRRRSTRALAVRMRALPCKAHAHALDEQFVPTACTSLIVGTLNRTIEEEAAANARRAARAPSTPARSPTTSCTASDRRWRDGRRYVGGFVDGRFGGAGVLTLPDEGTYAGGFVNGAFEGRRSEWRLLPPNDGASYRGAVVEGKAHGWGVVTATDGVAWEGDFEAGAPRHGYEVGLGVTMRGTLKRPGRADALVGSSAEAKAEYEAHIDEWQNVRRRAQFRARLHRVCAIL